MSKLLPVLLVGTLAITSADAGTPFPLANEDRLLPPSVELERKTQPWCPSNCVVMVPFVATYHPQYPVHRGRADSERAA